MALFVGARETAEKTATKWYRVMWWKVKRIERDKPKHWELEKKLLTRSEYKVRLWVPASELEDAEKFLSEYATKITPRPESIRKTEVKTVKGTLMVKQEKLKLITPICKKYSAVCKVIGGAKHPGGPLIVSYEVPQSSKDAFLREVKEALKKAVPAKHGEILKEAMKIAKEKVKELKEVPAEAELRKKIVELFDELGAMRKKMLTEFPWLAKIRRP